MLFTDYSHLCAYIQNNPVIIRSEIGAGCGNQTHDISLENFCIITILTPHLNQSLFFAVIRSIATHIPIGNASAARISVNVNMFILSCREYKYINNNVHRGITSTHGL